MMETFVVKGLKIKKAYKIASGIVLVSLLLTYLTLCSSVSVVNFSLDIVCYAKLLGIECPDCSMVFGDISFRHILSVLN